MPRSIDRFELQELIEKIEYNTTGKTTVCTLTLKNGFEVIAYSGLLDKVNFVKELGEQYALKAAIDKLWEFEGYHLHRIDK